MKTRKMMMALLFVCACVVSFVHAVETSIAYQGMLRTGQGNVVDNKQPTIEFRLYSGASGGDPIWGRSITVLLDAEGLFSVELSETEGSALQGVKYENLAEALKSVRNASLFVGLTVKDSAGEISPRQKILMVPFSSYASDVDKASGDFTVSGRAVAQSAKINNTLEVSGKATLAEAEVREEMRVQGDLTVASPGTISGYGTIPIGGIIMWSGSTVPAGWVLCDGKNGTPNLVDRFVRGSNLESAGSTGGSSGVTLAEKNLPPHTHNYAGDDQLMNIESGCTTRVKETSTRYDADSTLGGSHNSRVYKTSETGLGERFSILPPYYKLAYIMRKN